MKVGEIGRDTVTKFEGMITARNERLRGHTQVAIEALIEGKPHAVWFDEDRVEPIPDAERF